MITEKELKQAIAECMQDPVTGNKRSILADLIIIQDYLFGAPKSSEPAPQPVASYSAEPLGYGDVIETHGGSEFLDAVDGRKAERVWKLMDEMMEAIKILHPRMYASFIDKIYDL